MGCSGQKQPLTVLFDTTDETLTIATAATLTITTHSTISYALSNTNGGYTNTITGIGGGTYKLFTSGTWSGNIVASGNQVVSKSVSNVTYGGSFSLNITYKTLSIETTARIDGSVPITISNSGATLSTTVNTTNGEWNSVNVGVNALRKIVYGNGYWILLLP